MPKQNTRDSLTKAVSTLVTAALCPASLAARANIEIEAITKAGQEVVNAALRKKYRVIVPGQYDNCVLDRRKG